jgi:ribbon-helix-helix CopG family protein
MWPFGNNSSRLPATQPLIDRLSGEACRAPADESVSLGSEDKRWASFPYGNCPQPAIEVPIDHMKTTLNIDDTVMAELKREAARQGRTMSELVESALRLLLHRKPERPVPLPTFHSGGALLDIADRDVLYQAMEGR